MNSVDSFCLKTTICVGTMIVLSYVCDFFVLDHYQHLLPLLSGKETYISINKSKKETKFKKLILGDSTAHQFFDNIDDADSIYFSLACNQGVSVCGQFLLLDNYLTIGNRPEEVYLIYNPISFKNNLDTKYTYHYFLKPFFRREYKSKISEIAMKQIHQIPYFEYCQCPLIKGPSWAPDYQSGNLSRNMISPVSSDYLVKIDSLRNKYGFKLYIIPSYMPLSKKNKLIFNQRMIPAQNKFIAGMMHSYYKNIEYLPDSCFADGVHIANSNMYFKLFCEKMALIKQQVNTSLQ